MNKNFLLDIAGFTPDLLNCPSAWLGHLPFAAWVVKEVEPKIFVELGSHYGHSYFAFCQSVVEAGLSTKCYAVDTWQGDEHAGQYNNDIYVGVNEYNKEHYEKFSQLLKMTFDDATSCFEDKSIELLHIDGLHTYEAVRHDFESWLPKLAPGAVVMFHDTNVHERDFGVWKLWQELQVNYPYNIEFFHSHGLGVLQLNNAPDDKKLDWLKLGTNEKEELVNYFSALGSRQLERFQLNDFKQQISGLNQAVSDRDGQISSIKQALSEREAQVSVLYNSNSWRITRPLRAIMQQMKRIRRVAKRIKPAIKQHGGLKSAARKAMQLYRRDDLGGVKHVLNAVKRSVQVFPAQNSGEYDRNDYTEWVHRYDTVTDEMRATMHARIDSLNNKPLISVVMPTYNPRQEWLIEAIESVRRQIYPNWELCIADDASTDKAIRPILERYAKEDSRIKVVFREENGHISASSNSALELVSGEWVALLDHDDLLSEHALFWVADAINKKPDARLIYSDEDKIDEDGNRHGPYFKCDWNVDLFYSQNMFSHLGVYHADLLQKIDGFREGLEGAQDYDLALRCIEQIDAKQICHIPRVLYHWRVHAESTAQSNEAKPYAMLAGERALNEHFFRKKINATSELVGYGYRTHYALQDSLPMVSLIIPTRNGLQLLSQCVESILEKTTYPNYELLIIDNGSDELETQQYLKELKAEKRVRVIHDDRPFNYSALNNAAVKLAQGEVVGLLNNDVEVISPDWLSEMVSIALQQGVGAVGARLWYFNNTLQHGGITLGIGGWAGHAHKGFPKGHPGYVGRMSLISGFTAVTGACLIVRKELYEKIGGLNESDTKIACNDVDFCLRVREAGYRNVWTPYAELYHHESATRGFEDTPEKQARFAKEVEYMRQAWGDTFLDDPAYSPNLTLDHEDFSLAWPPRLEEK